MSEEKIITPLPRGWVSMDDAAIKITQAVEQPIGKNTLGRMARQAGIDVHRMNIITETMSSRGPRRKKLLVMCVREIEIPQIIAYVADRIANCDTLIDVEGKSKSPDPTPEEIRSMCLEIQANRERKRREMGWEEPEPVAEIPVIPIAKVHVYSRRAEY
jgi:hypothetical protein